MKNLLRLKNGNVELINPGNQVIRHYYSKGNCIRVDWFEEKDESILLQLSDGKILIMNRGCQVVKIFN